MVSVLCSIFFALTMGCSSNDSGRVCSQNGMEKRCYAPHNKLVWHHSAVALVHWACCRMCWDCSIRGSSL